MQRWEPEGCRKYLMADWVYLPWEDERTESSDFPRWNRKTPKMAAVIVIAGVGFPLWILVSTRYIADDENLKIVSGPFSWIIPVQTITSIQETQSAITSPAMSFDRLEITYGEDKAIIVSPADKEGFIKALGSDKLVVMGKRRTKEARNSEKKRKPDRKNS